MTDLARRSGAVGAVIGGTPVKTIFLFSVLIATAYVYWQWEPDIFEPRLSRPADMARPRHTLAAAEAKRPSDLNGGVVEVAAANGSLPARKKLAISPSPANPK